MKFENNADIRDICLKFNRKFKYIENGYLPDKFKTKLHPLYSKAMCPLIFGLELKPSGT